MKWIFSVVLLLCLSSMAEAQQIIVYEPVPLYPIRVYPVQPVYYPRYYRPRYLYPQPVQVIYLPYRTY